MSDIFIRTEQRAGRITLQRPDALNALTYPMCISIAEALKEWRTSKEIEVVVIDAEGDRAFCAGGDIADMYQYGLRGDCGYGRRYWRDEYRMNAAINEFPKPVISFMHGYVMGGGVGVGCHGSVRVVGESSRIAMPECSIGLVPDVGGSYLLSRGPGHTGECLGISGYRMDAADAIAMGFADHFIREEHWPDVIKKVCDSGDTKHILDAASPPVLGKLACQLDTINVVFCRGSLVDVVNSLEQQQDSFSAECLKRMKNNSPLSMACALALIRMQRKSPDLRCALGLEYRFVYRSLEQSDFLEGIRARIIDKDNKPQWQHADIRGVVLDEVEEMLAPLGEHELTWEVQV